MDDCWNCCISSSIDVILIWLLFILIWFRVVFKWWWDLVHCMVCIFLATVWWFKFIIWWSKRSAHVFLMVWWTHVLGVILLGSGNFCCLAIFNGWLLKLFYFFQYWCDFNLIVVHSYLILCCVKMMMGSGELYGLCIFTVWWFKFIIWWSMRSANVGFFNGVIISCIRGQIAWIQ
jgi:hypothetical protein